MRKKYRYYLSIFMLLIILSIFIVLVATNKFNNAQAGFSEGKCYDLQDSDVETNPETSPDYPTYETFLEAYFYNLRDNKGSNQLGSCGYVALGMMLSFYDTYLNDNIIPEIYDVPSVGKQIDMAERRKSPGIRKDGISYVDLVNLGVNKVSDLTAVQYFELMEKQANSETAPSLHAKLITIGESLGFYNYDAIYDKEIMEEKDMDLATYPCGTVLDQRVKILKTYLNEIGFEDKIDYEVITCTGSSSQIKKFTKSYIDKGYPVLLSLLNSEKQSRHGCVAYSYVGDDIYVNMGYINKQTHDLAGMGYDQYTSAMIIDFKMEHTHSYNYWVYSDEAMKEEPEKLCYCDSRLIHTHAEHNYKYYISSNIEKHKASCGCGDSIYEYHSFNYRYIVNSNTHIAYCVCGESIEEEHDYFHSCEKTSSNKTHINKCACGAGQEQNHVWKAYTKPTLLPGTYAQCKRCGFLKKLGSDEFVPVLPDRKKDTENM